MPRSRVLSFMSQWGGAPRSPTSENAPPQSPTRLQKPPLENSTINPNTPSPHRKPLNIDTNTPQSERQKLDQYAKNSPTPQSPSQGHTPSRARGDSRAHTRPNSMIQTYQPPQVEVAADTPPELQPIFSYLNSHSNKLYQEGYFLKLHDLDSRGRPAADRGWAECFAQLVGTVLSLWDAAALDTAGEDGEVVPTFINLSDASIKMIESLPMSGAGQGGALQNVLSISTAANNRYLLHFNSLSSLTQWTAGIRLAMFEHSTLQEAYTGSLIAGKGKFLNNIKQIMERSKFAHEDWARVRFGAGTPWKRCWCVVAPPDEKEYAKAQKALKKTSAYERVRLPKGEIRFYDTRKVTKKTRPIATITDAYAAYAIYPQSKPLIDQSTLVKLEGLVTVHSMPENTTEGFVFVMPEVHAAVSGFEMMLQFLFPVFDTFNLYGRPNRLIADTLDQRGLMFAMPRDRRYGYLDILDVSALIHTEGSQAWSERQWKRELKKLTSTRMSAYAENGSPRTSNVGQPAQRRNTTTSRFPAPRGGGVAFDDQTHSTPGSRSESPAPGFAGADRFAPPRRTDSAPPGAHGSPHKRSVSDAQGYKRWEPQAPSRLSYEASRPSQPEFSGAPPPPPKHGGPLGMALGRSHGPGSLERITSGDEVPTFNSLAREQPDYDSVERDMQTQNTASPHLAPPGPIASPPALTHNPHSRPANQPYQAPELRRAHSNVDAATLYQMQEAARQRDDDPDEEWSGEVQHRPRGQQQYGQSQPVAFNTFATNKREMPADRSQGALLKNGNTNMQRRERDPRQTLPTIEASPFVGGGEEEFFDAPSRQRSHATLGGGSGSGAGTPGELSEIGAVAREAPPLQTIRSSHSIARKPVPKKSSEAPRESTPELPRAPEQESREAETGSIVNDSLAGDWIEEAALMRQLENDSVRANTMTTVESSEPDYASTASSEHKPKQPVERQRAGKLKTVGDPDYAPAAPRESVGAGKFDTWAKDQAAQDAEVPIVDFGPTPLYKPSSRPGTSGTMTQSMMGDRSRSRSRERMSMYLSGNNSQDKLNRITPDESRRHSYFAGATANSSPNGMTPSGTPGDRHSIAWQPATTGHSPSTPGERQSLTPEQWVQYRAAMAAQPGIPPPGRRTPSYAHQRAASGDQLRRSMTKTPPPFARTNSGDWTQQAGAQRPPSRPQSRGANAYLGARSPGGTLMNAAPTNLTAKEQMHVARATGTPLINYSTNADKKKQEEQQPGLFGALAARQREKEESKKNRLSMHNPMVQQAIALRQQQQAEAEAAAQQAHYQQQMQQQAAQQAHMLQLQQLQFQQHLMAQNQQQQAMQQRPQVQTQSSWGQSQYGGMGQQGYTQSPSVYSPGGMQSPQSAQGGYTSPFAQRLYQSQQQQQAPNGQQAWQQQRRG